MIDVTLSITYFAFLLGFGVIVANLLKKIKIPDTFFLLLLGLLLGPTVFANPWVQQYMNITLVDINAMGGIPDFLRVLALILIVFTGTFNISLSSFKRLSDISINLALIGVVFNTLFLGIFAHYMFGLSLIQAFLLSSVISGTGTGVIVAFEDVVKKHRKTVSILKMESILNSPLTVLFPLLFLDLVSMESGALFEPIKYASQFWQMIVAGVGTGIIIGFGVSKFLKGMLKEYTVLLFLAIALITYALAEHVGGSGILAVAVCGLITGNMTFREKKEVQVFDDYFSEMLRISVFTMLGAQVVLNLSLYELQLAVLFFLIVFFCRPIFVIPNLGRFKEELERKDILMLSFVAPRGISSAAIAPMVASVIGGATGNKIMSIVFIVMLLSVLSSTLVARIIGREENSSMKY